MSFNENFCVNIKNDKMLIYKMKVSHIFLHVACHGTYVLYRNKKAISIFY